MACTSQRRTEDRTNTARTDHADAQAWWGTGQHVESVEVGSVPVVPSPVLPDLPTDLPTWEQAWQESAFGPNGFYTLQAPEGHFRTAVTAGRAIADLVTDYIGEFLEHHQHACIDDLGAASGQLLQDIATWSDDQRLSQRICLRGFDLRPRPEGLDSRINWVCGDLHRTLAGQPAITGIAIAHELLDDLPCPIIEADSDGRARVILAQDHQAYLGPPVDSPGHEEFRHWESWAAQWWPIERSFMRCEIGLPREHLWQLIVDHVASGWALAIDYGHVKPERVAGTWDAGTCIGYRDGRAVAPRTDGHANLTAHVAMDALQASTPSGGTLRRLPMSSSMPPGMYLLATRRGSPVSPS